MMFGEESLFGSMTSTSSNQMDFVSMMWYSFDLLTFFAYLCNFYIVHIFSSLTHYVHCSTLICTIILGVLIILLFTSIVIAVVVVVVVVVI